MSEVDLLQAWQEWQKGEVKDLILYGKQIFWWGRVGKVLELVSATMIIAEVIGSERLRRFGLRLHGFSAEEKAKRLLHSPNKIVTIFFTLVGAWLSLTLSYIFTSFLLSHFGGPSPALGIFTFGVCAFILFLIGIVVLPIAGGDYVARVGSRIDTVIIQPTAWALDRPHVTDWVKVISVLLLLIGFHFDLLSS